MRLKFRAKNVAQFEAKRLIYRFVQLGATVAQLKILILAAAARLLQPLN